MTDHSKRVRAEVTQLRKLMPIGPSPWLGDVISLLCHCGERLSEDCDCACRLAPEPETYRRYTCDISLPYCHES
jgi:hypothetical protein